MGRLYDAFIEVGPRFAGFGDIKKQGSQAGKAYGQALTEAAEKAAKANMRRLGEALAKARNGEAEAAGKVRVAEKQLAESRKKYAADSSQLAAAEERLAAAQRKSAAASSTAKDATDALDKARKQVEGNADNAGKNTGNRFSQAFKKGLSKLGGNKEGKEFATRFGVGMNGAIGGIVSRSAGIFVAGFAAVKSVDLFKDFISEARESRKVGELTAAVIKSTGGAAKLSAAQIGDLATAISNKTGADDEAVQSGENLLLTFTNIKNGVGKGNDIFNQATQAVTDMTAALNDGQVTQEGVKASSIQLGKALNDPIKGVTALQKVGVSFTADQKKQIKTLVDSGKTMDAQKIILRELSKEFGGAAAAATDPLTKLDTIVGNVKETIGGAFLPVVDKAAAWLGDVLPGAVAKSGQFFSSKLLPPLKAVSSFVTGTLFPGFEGLYGLLVKHDFSKEFGKAFHVEEDSPIVSFLLSINEGVKTAAANAKMWAGSIIKGLTSGFGSGDWEPLGKALGTGIIDGLKALGSGGGEILDAISGLVDKIDWSKLGSGINNGIKGLLHSVDWKGIGDALGDAVVSIFGKATTLSDKVGQAFKDLMARIDWKKIGRDSTDAIGQFVEGVDWVKVAKTLAVAAIKSLKFDKNVYDTVTSSAADLVIGMATEIGKAIGRWFADAGKWLYGKGKDLVSGLLSGASDQASGVGAWFSGNVIGPVVGAFKSARTWLVSHGQSLLEGFKDGISKAAKGVGDWIMRAPVAQILLPFLSAAKWLTGPGRDFVTGFKNGIVNTVKGIGTWLGRNVISPTVEAFSKSGAWLVRQGANLIAGFKNGVTSIAKSIGGWFYSNVISPALLAFSKAGTWLVQQGKNIVAGFKNGVTSIASGVGSWMYGNVIVPVVKPFGKAGTWLFSHGTNLIAGLLSGISADMKGIGKWLKANVVDPIVSGVKHFFGIKSPSTVFAGIGSHLIGGLMKGLSTTNGAAIAKKIFGDMPSALQAIVGKGLVSVQNLPKKALDALGSSIGIGSPIGGPRGNQSNVGVVRTLASQYGWGTGYQWDALYNLIMGESGFNSNAQNPTSSAYGIFQFLNSTWGSVGASKTADPWGQTIAGLKYIARSYGSPAQAFAAWSSRSPHWYKKGTPWVPDDQLAYLHKGEAVLPAEVNKRRMAGLDWGGRIRGELHQMHEAHVAHLAHMAHAAHLNHLSDVPRFTTRPSVDTVANGVASGVIRLHPDDMRHIAGLLTSSPLQVNVDLDGRKLDSAMSRSALGRGF